MNFQNKKIKLQHQTPMQKNSIAYTKRNILSPYLSLYLPQIIITTLSIIGAAGIVLVFGNFIKSLVDQKTILVANMSTEFILTTISLSIMTMSIFSFGRIYGSSFLSEKITSHIRTTLFNHTLMLDVSYYDTRHPSDFVSCFTTDLSLIQHIVQTTFPILLRNMMLMIGGFAMMIMTSFKLTALSLILVPCIVGIAYTFGKNVRHLSKDTQESFGNLSVILEEIFTNIRTCLAFNHQSYDQRTFENINNITCQIAIKRSLHKAKLSSIIMTIAFAAIAALVYIGLQDINNGTLTAGSLSSFIFYALLVAGTAGSYAENYADIKKASGAFDRILELLSITPHVPTTITRENRAHIPSRGTVAIHNMNFTYPSAETPTLQQINFSINPGEKIAIVGPSGAGKSTIFSLIMRYYYPQNGNIYIDGQDYDKLTPHEIRQKIALVPQEPALFSTSLLDNILYGNPNATSQELKEALRIAKLEEVIKDLPQGIHTLVGPRGIRLSGGQKQRIAIARAILRNPVLLLLDEATSALDAENEQAVQEGLRYLTHTRSSLIIAHRLSTVLHAEKIIVLDQGIIQGIGTHAELCDTNSLYRKLATIQFGESLIKNQNKKII